MPPKCQKCPNTCYCVATFDCMHVILVTKYCIARLIAVEPALLLFFFFFPVWPVGSRKKKKKNVTDNVMIQAYCKRAVIFAHIMSKVR